MSVTNFMASFGPPVEEALLAPAPGGLDKFLTKFNGVTESYWFYNHTIELRFEPADHVYYLVGDLGALTAQDGVTNVCHIIDRSPALVPWAAKMVVEKLLRTLPTHNKELPVVVDPAAKDYVAGGNPTYPVVHITEMSLEDFTKIVMEAKTAPRDVLEEAGDIGHMAHTWLEYYIKALIAGHKLEVESKLLNLPKDERAANCDMAALGWMHQHNVRWIATERKIYSRKYQVAGTTDGLALVDSCDDLACCPASFKDRLSVADWKSSNHLYIEYLYQTAIYQEALMEEFGQPDSAADDADGRLILDAIRKYGPIEDRWILRLGKHDGEFEPWHTTADDFQEDLEGFLDALSLTRSVRLTHERMKGQKNAIKAAKKVAKELAAEKEKAEKKAAKALERESKRVAKETAKMEERKAKAQAKMDAKAAKMNGLQIKTVIVDELKDLPPLLLEKVVAGTLRLKPGSAFSYAVPTVKPSVVLTAPAAVPAEVLTPRPKFELPEEQL